MNLKYSIQTAILVVGFFSLLVFSASYNFILLDTKPTEQPLKDALSITASFFGGFATLTAAYIASKLFNNWKEQHNLQIIAYEAKQAFHLFHNQRDFIHNFKYQIEGIIKDENLNKLSEKNIAISFRSTIVEAYDKDKDYMSSFCFLTREQNIYDITMQYYKAIQDIDTQLATKANQSFSDFRFLNKKTSEEFLELFRLLEEKNTDVLNELKKFIFVK